ncbi:putative outer membrane protein [Myroides odoratimimus]|uniref:RagB/SusD family nutrient uptake outer membrane protein n=1 Tax=Myroides odoratimimus TaxID=76832 RepID=UPI000728D14B|nr:RagB/SusD family nutrient uptake outer membrane protein [Myroides odoratimimus]GAQ15695.1 hypothetical protein MODO_3395 [Myroides odoratimimus]GAQ15744.1 hypothetical protein MODO_3449 [Myroides odoratimimus]GAQ15987.1 hypothetical protein MODO_3692 [Myroides odoratimimus]GAQ15990.1 putative outer membrane protein [Myroides odoratimimus]
MKTKHLFILYLFVLPILSTSCENAIQVDMPNNQMGTDDIYKDISTTKAALATLYSNFRDASIFTGQSTGLGTVMSMYTDELTSFSEINSSLGTFDIFNNSIRANNPTINSLWNSSYKNIYAINSFIQGVTLSKHLNINDKDPLIAKALLLRSIYYQNLVQLFGDIPYTTTTDYQSNIIIKKTPYLQVLSLIELDLKHSLTILSDTFEKQNRIYPNKAAAELLLAQNYLLQHKYDLAQNLSSLVTSNPLFALETDITKVFKNNAKSTIWQLIPSNSGLSTWEARTYYFNITPPTNHALSQDLIKSFSINDLRLKHWVREVSGNNKTFYHSYKYKNISNNTDEYSIVFRVEQAYFVLIESLIYQDNTVEAIKYLNLLKKRANISLLPNTLTKEECIKEMLIESQKEFFTEQGHRFFDLKRNNQLHILNKVKPNWKTNHRLLPYPEKEISLNNNLLPQNDGY